MELSRDGQMQAREHFIAPEEVRDGLVSSDGSSGPTRRATRCKVYVVGSRFPHHAKHSGYEGFARYVGRMLRLPLRSRWLGGDLGWAIDRRIATWTRPHYSSGILLIEAAAALHMLVTPRAVYHLIYGDVDLWMLPRLRRLIGSRHRLVVSFHEPRPPDWVGLEKVAPDIDAVVLVSASQRAALATLYPPERTFVIPHGIDTGFFEPGPKRSGERVVLTVGSHLRDFETLGAAIDLVLSKHSNVRFVAVGTRERGREYEGLEHERVTYLDKVDDEELRRLYQTATLMVLPFRHATANNALLEAMACGLPVVATDVGAVREYLGDQAGLLCEPRDAAALSQAMIRILESPELATQMGEAGRARALELDYRKVAEQMQHLYDELLSR